MKSLLWGKKIDLRVECTHETTHLRTENNKREYSHRFEKYLAETWAKENKDDEAHALEPEAEVAVSRKSWFRFKPKTKRIGR